MTARPSGGAELMTGESGRRPAGRVRRTWLLAGGVRPLVPRSPRHRPRARLPTAGADAGLPA